MKTKQNIDLEPLSDQSESLKRKRRKSGRSTIDDVAKLADVSAITVSRALKNPEIVSKKLHQRINQAISELNYIIDPNASALASAGTNVIGVIIPSISNTVFDDTIRAIYDKVSGTKYQIQIANYRYSQSEEERLIQLFIGQGAVALLVTGVDQSVKSKKLLKNIGIPVVQIMETTDDPIDMNVGCNHYAAAVQSTQHLLDQGYRNLASISARMDPRARRRLNGFKDTLISNQLYRSEFDIQTEELSSVTLGKELCKKLLDQYPEVDSIYCNNDDLALGALFACQENNIAIPEKIGIVGFNDLEYVSATHPQITSVNTPRYDMGKLAIELIINAIEKNSITSKIIDTGFELKIRNSTIREA